MSSSSLRHKVQALLLHEKQEPGSMLCAQHALNNLLQGYYFDAPQLAEIASQLDDLERDNLEMSDADWNEREAAGRNADETGFFSVSVLETALQVWGFSLLRWGSAEMRQYQNSPETQLAFILNLSNHWFCFRSFGSDANFWFNLNSFLPEPSWVGSGYLGALLDQSQREGYSVFVVRPTSDDPSSRRNIIDQFRSTPGDQAASGSHLGQDDEDDELQRAIQASMAESTNTGSAVASGSHGSPHAGSNTMSRRASSSQTSHLTAGESSRSANNHADRTTVGKRRKNRRQGEEDLQEALESRLGAQRTSSNGAGSSSRMADGATSADAIDIDDSDEENGAVANLSSSTSRSPFLDPALRDQILEDIDDDDELDLNEDPPRHRLGTTRTVAPHDAIEINSDDGDEAEGDDFDIQGSAAAFRAFSSMRDRDYDDEDAQLQRALAASLAGGSPGVGDGGQMDDFGLSSADAAEQNRILEQIRRDAASASAAADRDRLNRSPTPADVGRIAKMREEARRKEREERERAERRARGEYTPEPEKAKQTGEDSSDDDDDDDDDEGQAKDQAAKAGDDSTQPEHQLSPEELRRIRLARFGG
ncbi:unnamed protein product [Sympodiomycopsis kandeliae]